jgi:hypothetical protein
MSLTAVKRVQIDSDVREYPNLAFAFMQVKTAVTSVFPELRGIKLFVGCPHGLGKHSHHQWKDEDKSGKNWRAFMHTGHFKDTICVHPHADVELPMRNLIGMMLHEFGHQINDIINIPNTQKNADGVIQRFFGIKIKYSQPGRVQYADI